MNLHLYPELAETHHSGTQIARVLTEGWIARNMFCPRCGHPQLAHFGNNKPVADFYCSNCGSQYELKSKKTSLGRKINDGAYDTMIERITSNNNPDFFFLHYSADEWKVKDLLMIPKHFFVPDIIEKRKPLSSSAQRSGWIGCQILIHKIPEQGRIPIITEGIELPTQQILKNVNRSNKLLTDNLNARGWLMDILNCINSLKSNTFSLSDIYGFERILTLKHPKNNNIRAKIRQQLQYLRDKGFILFLGNGKYKKIN